jgi:N-acetylglucosamine-6-phosphate deacetylase
MSQPQQNGATWWQILTAQTLYAPEAIAGPISVILEGPTIRDIWRGVDAATARSRFNTEAPHEQVTVIDLGAWRLAPGFIDLHTHGFGGHDVTTGSAQEVAAMARELPRSGVTAFFPTIATLGQRETRQQVLRLAGLARQKEADTTAALLGLRLEGPYINPAKKGAQYEPGIRPPDVGEIEDLATVGQGWVRVVDFAPEEDPGGRFLDTLVRLGILPCMGHTAATYEQALRALDGGVRHSTHLFNAMAPLTQREPGVVGALLTDARATVEIIADGIHLHPAVIRLILATRGFRDIALITDAIAPAGLAEGKYTFVGRTVTVHEGAARLEDGTLAGSVLTLDRAISNMVAFAGCEWSEAIAMATRVPATIAGVAPRKGRIVPGADADLVALDEQGVVQRTWVRGHLAYQRA